MLVIGFTAGEIPTVKVNRLLLNNVSVVGVGWGAYVLQRPGHIAKEWAALEPHLKSGAIQPVVGPTFPLGGRVAGPADAGRATRDRQGAAGPLTYGKLQLLKVLGEQSLTV